MQTFNESKLKTELLNAIKELGFETPTPIQAKVIPHILSSEQDLIAMAQTGTGKTAAFGLPILEQIDKDENQVQALILAPTRELGMQIAKDLETYSKLMKEVNIVPVYGGTNIVGQIKDLQKKVQIVVGTPGRTLDLLKRKKLKISQLRWLVLDEADEMLSMGFKDELEAILEKTPATRQTLLFSATMPKEIVNIAKRYMKKPEQISVSQKNISAENVTHIYYKVHAKNKYLALKRIVDINPNIFGIVFCRTRQETKDVAGKLMSDGYNADALHGDLSQAQRDYVMHRFHIKNIQLLVATDVAARGIDVNDLTHIINYNLPDDPETYIHRSGRTGRAGKKGTSVAIINAQENKRIKHLEKITGKVFEHKLIPSGQEICEKQLYKLIDKVEKVEINQSQIEKFLPEIYKKLEWLSREDLIKHFVSVEFNRFLEYYKDSDDLNVKKKEKGNISNVKYTRFFINLGKKDNLTPGSLMGIINKNADVGNADFGEIEILKTFSFFEFDNQYNDILLKAFGQKNIDGKKVIIEPTKNSPSPRREKRKKYNANNKSYKRNNHKRRKR